MKKFFFLNATDRAVMATLVTILAIAAMAVFFTSCTRDDDPESAPQSGSPFILTQTPFRRTPL